MHLGARASGIIPCPLCYEVVVKRWNFGWRGWLDITIHDIVKDLCRPGRCFCGNDLGKWECINGKMTRVDHFVTRFGDAVAGGAPSTLLYAYSECPCRQACLTWTTGGNCCVAAVRATTVAAVAAGGPLPLGDLGRELSAPEVAPMIRSRAL